MRLMWAGLLVLLPLVAELANAQRCSGVPDVPEHSAVRCFKKRGTCRAMCDVGYIFQGKGAKSALFTCVGGQWEMRDGHEDRCRPLCDPPCQNGDCIEPGTCVCEEGYTGDYCDEEEYDEDYATEEPTDEGYGHYPYGFNGNADNHEEYEEEAEAEDYDESEEIEDDEEPDEPEAEPQREADAENEEDEVALYFRSLEQSVKNWDTRDRRRLVHKVQMVFYVMAEAIDGRLPPPPCAAITT